MLAAKDVGVGVDPPPVSVLPVSVLPVPLSGVTGKAMTEILLHAT